MRRSAAVMAPVGFFVAQRLYPLVAHGGLSVDTVIGRSVRPLGPVEFPIAAPREVAFDVIAAAYHGRTPRALQHELEVWERGSDMVLAAHFNQVKRGTTTVETVRFRRPERIDFRPVRGPVPHVVESFPLEPADAGTTLTWQGEFGSDSWALGACGANGSSGNGRRRCDARLPRSRSRLSVVQAERPASQ